jgi:predicted naringenin-chalcone synthase
VPAFCHQQMDILQFMQRVYATNDTERRKLRFMYHQSGIQQRYSVLADYSKPVHDWKFYPQSESLEPFPTLEQRMAMFNKQASLLSVDAIRNCLDNIHDLKEITHLITVSCTGMSAPGLDLQVMELMDFDKHIFRTSVNFMGCYAAIHALKIGHALCDSNPGARVLIVCTELCTLHFQREATLDNMTSSLLFGDGSAAILMTADSSSHPGLYIDGFYSEIIVKGKRDMAWELSSSGFLMTLSGYVPDLIEEDFRAVVQRAIGGDSLEEVSHWCMHPGGKRILEAVSKSTGVSGEAFRHSYHVLQQYGNLSSASVMFVLKEILQQKTSIRKLFGAAFGPGLTVETFTAHN